MDRSEYLKLCQQVSVFTAIGHKIPQKMLVKNFEISYIPHGYEITFKNGNPRHTAILRDLRANSVTYADLERIKKNEKVHL